MFRRRRRRHRAALYVRTAPLRLSVRPGGQGIDEERDRRVEGLMSACATSRGAKLFVFGCVARAAYACSGAPQRRTLVLGRRSSAGYSSQTSYNYGYEVLQDTDGHVHWPFGEIVTPQLLPLPLGLAIITY